MTSRDVTAQAVSLDADAPDWRDRAADLADQLVTRGVLRDPALVAAVQQTPRHVFVPSYVKQQPDGTWRAYSRDDLGTVEQWRDTVYADVPLTTALRDEPDGHATPISSSSKPGLMTRMLETLELDDNCRVLEIGTGTGYNAALLAHRLGDQQVASVDVEPALVATAAHRLATIGRHPTLAATDGSHGLPEAAPYDRIIATCSVPAIPDAWRDQLTPDGRVLTDLKINGGAGNLIDLHRHGDVLEGRFLPAWAGFMPLRPAIPVVDTPRQQRQAASVERQSAAPSASPWWDHQIVWLLAALELPPGIVTGVRLDPDRGIPTASTVTAADGSWAEIAIQPDANGHRDVRGGGGDLWHAVERAYIQWDNLDQPGWDRLGLTSGAAAVSRLWLGTPEGEHHWPLPPIA